MKHTKNILKSLLITVMALSLLAVSCKKDEGGSKPTDPTPITLGLKELNSIVTGLVQLQTKWGVEEQAITGFAPKSGNGSISVTVATAFTNIDELKTALSSRNQAGVKVTVAANSTFGPANVSEKKEAKFDITIDIGSNNFAKEVEGPYAVNGKTATLTLTITPTNKWDGKN